MFLTMTRFGPSIEPITFPTPSRYATCYATDAGIALVHKHLNLKFSLDKYRIYHKSWLSANSLSKYLRNNNDFVHVHMINNSAIP